MGGFLQLRHLVGPPAAIFSSRAVARARSLDCLALVHRLASFFLRDTRCTSAQVSHLVCPSMAGLGQCRQRPKDFSLSCFSLCWVRCFSRLASGVSGVLFAAGFSGGDGFLVLFIFDGAFFFPPGWGSWKVSTKSCLLGMVHPRACGGTACAYSSTVDSAGLSPRLRGNLLLADYAVLGAGSIPAPAGNLRRVLGLEQLGGSIPAPAGEPSRRALAK